MAARKYWAVQLLLLIEDKYLVPASGIVGFCPFNRFSSIDPVHCLTIRITFSRISFLALFLLSHQLELASSLHLNCSV
jgi:hypothetical protein